ncbi:MAG TPA: hypothetical protein ENI26_13105 [Methylophaga aminisulfidivorans]|uniref:TnsA endonuclease N-terminal domain-containing protein n=1 Tax=Methylophaga aminisulfidivorans TaxID=230105 RepID=A0A7C1ZIT9_9GAMM|nr:hypothetical protein [Methylophaga aminisulfidivorans]
MVKNELKQLIDEAYERPRRFGIYQGVRKFKHGEMFKNVWFMHSIKNRANIACESDLEKHLCMHMEFENAVESYRPQPFKLKFDDFSYTPDFLVKCKNGLYKIREAKRLAEAESSKYKEKFEVVTQYCNKHGVDFEIFTEADISKKVLITQNFVYHLMRGKPVSPADMEACYQALKKQDIKTAKLLDVRDFVESLGFDSIVIIQLIAQGILKSNIAPHSVKNAYVSMIGGAV